MVHLFQRNGAAGPCCGMGVWGVPRSAGVRQKWQEDSGVFSNVSHPHPPPPQSTPVGQTLQASLPLTNETTEGMVT